MKKTEAIGLETMCEEMFAEIGNRPSLSMALTGKLRVQHDRGYFTFDVDTGDIVYLNFTGFMVDLEEIRIMVKEIVSDDGRRGMLKLLLWSYQHIGELTDDEGEQT